MKSNVVEIFSDDKGEGAEPPIKRHKRNYEEQILTSVDDSSLLGDIKEPAELSSFSTLDTTTGDNTKSGTGSGLAVTESTLDGRALLYVGNGIGNVLKPNVLGSYHNSHHELLQSCSPHYESLVPSGPSGQLHEDNSSNPTCFEDKSKQDKVAGGSYSSQLDIISSDNGEAKISLICDSSVKFDIRMPNVDAVLEIVEDKFRKRFGISDAEFSVRKLMKEFCECLLAVVQQTPDIKNSDCDVLSNGKYNQQSNFKTQPCHSFRSVDDSQDRVDKESQVSEPVQVDACSGKDELLGNTLIEKEKKNDPTLGVTKNSLFVEDITRGEERQPISLVSDNGSLELPKFFYIPRNIVFKNAYVNFSLARISDHNCCSSCSGNCLSAPANCACTGETRGDFAYTPDGLLEEKFLNECLNMSRRKPRKDHLYYCENCPLENIMADNSKQLKRKRSKKPCKGHLMRKFIKECWAKCGCNRNCGNRVVQRGITLKLQVFQTSQGKGWGLRTLEPLQKGTFVCEYVGEIVTNMELHQRNEESAGEEHTYPVLLDGDWASERHLKDEEALCLDATKFGNVARFINHRCHDANLVEIPVEVETPDHHYYHIAFFTSRKIEVNEELTWDYGIDFDDETHPIKAFDCKCGSLFCCMKNRYSS